MQITLSAPRAIRAQVALPASKSISNRALILNALSGNDALPMNLSDCDDTRVMVEALFSNHDLIDIKAAGTAMRFLTAYRSITPGSVTITGTQRMRQRPIRILVDALRSLGADIQYTEQEGFPPLRITGRELTGNEITLKGDVSSQYISALLMIAPTLPDGLTLRLQGEVVSRPYINLTLQLMHDFGAEAGWTDSHTIKVPHGQYCPTSYSVESDWSAASYWYEIVALAPQAEVRLKGLFAKSYQGDSAVARLFERLGVRTTSTDDGVTLTKCSSDSGTSSERNYSAEEGTLRADETNSNNNIVRNGSFEDGGVSNGQGETLGNALTSSNENVNSSCVAGEAFMGSASGSGIYSEWNSFTEEGEKLRTDGTTPNYIDSKRSDEDGQASVARVCSSAKAGENSSAESTPSNGGASASRFDYDFVNEPDLAQTFVVTCALMGVPFRFTGLQSLKIKETDRIAALRRELLKLGYVVREADDSVLYWDGERCTAEAEPAIDTYEDHRMAMAFAPACLVLPQLRVNNPEVVSKSYPAYWNHLTEAGFSIREAENKPSAGSGLQSDLDGKNARNE